MRHPSFLKIGLHVKVRMANGALLSGRVDGNDLRSNGVWTAINVSPLGVNRVIKRFRPSQLKPA